VCRCAIGLAIQPGGGARQRIWGGARQRGHSGFRGRTAIWPLKVDLRSFHGNVFCTSWRCIRQTRSTLTNFGLHRDGSACGRPRGVAPARDPGGAKQPYGVRPARPLPGERTATLSYVAPQKPLRAARRLLKRTGSISSRSDGPRPAAPQGKFRPLAGRGDGHKTAASQLVRGSACGQPRRAMVQRICMSAWLHRSAARGPIQNQWGRASDASGHRDSAGSGVPLLGGLLVRSPWLPQLGLQLPAPGRCSQQSPQLPSPGFVVA
jgi:hypothetical protein